MGQCAIIIASSEAITYVVQQAVCICNVCVSDAYTYCNAQIELHNYIYIYQRALNLKQIVR